MRFCNFQELDMRIFLRVNVFLEERLRATELEYMEPDMEELLLEPMDWLAEWMEAPDWLLDEWMDDSCPST